ncbi:ABC transporter permease [Occallatibacter riparius]|uniref:ABC transporter permease n=1 Tax=Occallatibacter riparius TaxID=1002689 RepID=A0A9J7BWN7_9BACT|nr:ABC transporter permease [Occallatibacter riparius]UWZ85437.1 ABC transporter permease [Occallatibacter riparius]
MDLVRSLLSRMVAMFQRRRLDASLDEELRVHIDLAIEEQMRRGVPEAEARRLALREFGGVTQVRETYREQRGLPLIEQIRRDIRYGIFQLWKSPGFALTAILTLALGVGANTTVFSMINGLLLRPLPVPESDRLAVVGMQFGAPNPNYSFPEPLFRAFERRHGAFSTTFAFNHTTFQVKSGASTENIQGQYVSGGFFDALRTVPMLGRTLNAQDDRKGGDSAGFAAVISETLWENRYHRDPAILGQRIVIDNVAFTIVGVMPRSFFGADPLQRPQFFVPLADEEVLAGERSLVKFGHRAWWLNVMGRLAPGATLEQASKEVGAAEGAVLREAVQDADWIKRTEQERHIRFFAEPGSTGFTYIRLNFRKPLMAVFAMCGGILLLACMNLASLLMARGTARQKELATRMALGATRRRLIQQLMIEGLLLGVTGTIAGLALAPAVSHLLVAVLLSGHQQAHLDTSLDWRVFAFASATAVLATLLFALVPAIKATSRNLMERMKDGQNATRTIDRSGILPRVLMGAEVGVALLLVVGAGLIATSLVRLYHDGMGFDPRGLENIEFSMENSGLKGDALMSFYREMGQRLSHAPGVTSVSYELMTPLIGYQWDEDYNDTRGAVHDTFMNSVAPAYFSTMRIPLLAGRDFTWDDTPSVGKKLILNQTAAGQLFPDGPALGRTIRHEERKKLEVYEVVGIVGDAKYADIHSVAPPTGYVPMPQNDFVQSASFVAVVRTNGSTGSLMGTARAITAQMAPQVPVPEVTSMEKIIDDAMGPERMMTLLAVFFAVCALVVTAIGLYGTLAYATARRTTEIGIRMALGAKRSQVVAMVFGQNLWVVMGGTVVGLAAALLVTRALASFLFSTSAHDPWVIAASICALGLAACAASLLPALRAARIEPMAAIRCE